MITTRKLYDDVVGIQNVKIRLYKIKAEREVPISWSEVSANSGGEGFLVRLRDPDLPFKLYAAR